MKEPGFVFHHDKTLEFTQPLTEMSTRNIKIIMFMGSKVRRVRRADNRTAICEPIALIFLNTFSLLCSVQDAPENTKAPLQLEHQRHCPSSQAAAFLIHIVSNIKMKLYHFYSISV
jgi:hypothetical protein